MSRPDDWFGRQLRAIVAESRLDALIGRVQDRWARRLEDDAPPIALGR